VVSDGWHRVDPVDLPSEGRVRSVTVDGRTVARARCGGRLGALENRCPHQGGPLGEGSIENGWLWCPWHGYDYDPLTGRPPEGFSDGPAPYEVADRADGLYVRIAALAPQVRTVADVLVETLVAFGITHAFGTASAYGKLIGRPAGIKAVRRDQLDAAMTQLFAADDPAMLHVEQDPELL
jgi:nitrite reductase/ring-hydroxylating ferredoxin subunit